MEVHGAGKRKAAPAAGRRRERWREAALGRERRLGQTRPTPLGVGNNDLNDLDYCLASHVRVQQYLYANEIKTNGLSP